MNIPYIIPCTYPQKFLSPIPPHSYPLLVFLLLLSLTQFLSSFLTEPARSGLRRRETRAEEEIGRAAGRGRRRGRRPAQRFFFLEFVIGDLRCILFVCDVFM
jgi:hypothetical protein